MGIQDRDHNLGNRPRVFLYASSIAYPEKNMDHKNGGTKDSGPMGEIKNSGQQQESKMQIETTEKWVTTGVIYYCNVTWGLAGSFLAPALMSFAAQHHTDMQTLSLIITISRYINIASSLAFGFIFSVLNRHAIVTFLVFQMAVVVALMPYSGSLTVLGLLITLLGISFGGYNTAQSIWVIEIWKEKAGPFVQAQHCVYAIGCIIPPIIFAPFLEKHQSASVALNATNTEPTDHMAAVYIPSLICGALVCIGAVLMLVTFLVYGRSKPSAVVAVKLDNGPSKQKDGLKKPPQASIRKFVVIAFSSLMLGAIASMEIVASFYLPTYAHYAFGFTEAAAANLFSVYQTSYAVTRLAGIFIIMKVSPKYILIANISLVAGGSLFLIFTTSATSAYIGSIILGMGYSTAFATVYTYLQSHLELTNVIAAVLLVGGRGLSSFTPMVVGSYIETFPNIVTWMNVGTDAIMAVSLVIFGIAVSGAKGKL